MDRGSISHQVTVQVEIWEYRSSYFGVYLLKTSYLDGQSDEIKKQVSTASPGC